MQRLKTVIGLLLGLVLLTAACAPAATAPADPSATPLTISEDARPIFNDIQQDLALRAEVAADQIELTELERVEWPDAGLGCPQADNLYAQVITPGYLFEFQVKGETYEYHAADEGFFVLCDQGVPQAPVIEATDPS